MRILSLAALLLPTLAFAAPQKIDPLHSSVTFEAKHFLVASIPGRFNEFSGSINLGEDFTQSQVEFTVQVASIDTSVDQRDAHLRTADFFDAANFPEATFRSTEITREKEGYRMKGNLTIRGTTLEETFWVTTLGKAMDPMLKAERSFFRAEGAINRKKYGVNYGDNALVSDMITLIVNLESLPQTK